MMSLQQSDSVSVALPFERTPERVNLAPDLLSRSVPTVGITVPGGPLIVTVPGGTSPPVGTLVLNEKLSLRTPRLSVEVVTADTSVTCCGALSEYAGLVTAEGFDEVERLKVYGPPVAVLVTSSSVIVMASPALIASWQQSDRVSVALPFERVPERPNEAPVVLSRIVPILGSTVPGGASILIVPGATSPPVEPLAVKPKEYLTCWIPPAAEESVTPVTP